jgi:hypothetical protein
MLKLLIFKYQNIMVKLLRMKMMLLLCALVAGSSAWADPTETVGNTDNTSAFWSAFSDYYTIQPNRSLRLSFTNHSDKAKTFHTWVGVITSDFDRASAAASDTEGYWEYLVLRGDNGRWGNSNAAGTFTSNFTRSGDDDATVEKGTAGLPTVAADGSLHLLRGGDVELGVRRVTSELHVATILDGECFQWDDG